jgi:hypothetical protein
MTRRTSKAAAAPKAAAAAETPAPPVSGALAALETTLAAIYTRMNDVLMAAYDAQALSGLLDSLHDAGFEEASKAHDNAEQRRWWEQAGYIARMLDRLGSELQANGEAIETALADLKYGRAPQ